MATRTEQLHAGIPILIGQAARQWRRALDRRLQPFGLSEATWRPLLHLSRAQGPMRQKELAASLGLDGSSVVRLLDALQAAGFVERREEAADRRARALVLTPPGQEIVARVEEVAVQVRDETLAGLSEPELAAAHGVLARICERLADAGEAAP